MPSIRSREILSKPAFWAAFTVSSASSLVEKYRANADAINAWADALIEAYAELDDEIERIAFFEVVTGRVISTTKVVSIFPATHFVTNPKKLEEAMKRIKDEMEERVEYFKSNEKYLEAQRIKERTNYDLEMISEIGTCSGIENYSRHMSLRGEGETPAVLIDFFKNNCSF